MGSDVEVIRDILNRAGVVYEDWVNTHPPEGEEAGIIIRAGEGPKNAGYREFLSVLTFNAEGDLEKWGTWE